MGEGSSGNGGGDRRRLLALGALLALVALAGCTGTQPRHFVCATCEDMEYASETKSSVHIQLFENGTSRWTLTVREQNSTLTAYDRQRLTERVRSTGETRYEPAHHGRTENVRGSLTNGTIVVTFLVENVADRKPGGYLVFDGFLQIRDAWPAYHLGAARVTVTAPHGMAIANDPPGANVTDDGRSVGWERGDGHSESIHKQTYIVAGPDRSRRHQVGANLVIAADVLGWGGGNLISMALGGMMGATVVVWGLIGLVTPGRARRRMNDPTLAVDWRFGLGMTLPVLASLHKLTTLPVGGEFTDADYFIWTILLVWVGFVSLGVTVGRQSELADPVAWALIGLPLYSSVSTAFVSPVSTSLGVGDVATAVALYGLVYLSGAVLALPAVRLSAGTWRVEPLERQPDR